MSYSRVPLSEQAADDEDEYMQDVPSTGTSAVQRNSSFTRSIPTSENSIHPTIQSSTMSSLNNTRTTSSLNNNRPTNPSSQRRRTPLQSL